MFTPKITHESYETIIDKYSDYVIYADESGDHDMSQINSTYPVFVLAFCVFEKRKYIESVVPLLQNFKFKYFGHDMIILHEREIKKATGPFSFLADDAIRENFYSDLNCLIEHSPMTIIAAAIHKNRLSRQYIYPENPYAIALTFCLERAYRFIEEQGSQGKLTHLIVEARGKKEDNELELAFRRICQGDNYQGKTINMDIIFAKKVVNSTGMQLGDLIARPIGRHVLNPNQDNRAFDIIKNKFRKNPNGSIHGWGLKIFP